MLHHCTANEKRHINHSCRQLNSFIQDSNAAINSLEISNEYTYSFVFIQFLNRVGAKVRLSILYLMSWTQPQHMNSWFMHVVHEEIYFIICVFATTVLYNVQWPRWAHLKEQHIELNWNIKTWCTNRSILSILFHCDLTPFFYKVPFYSLKNTECTNITWMER